MTTQFSNAAGNTVDCIFAAIISVLRLLFLGRPSDIARFIIAVSLWVSVEFHVGRAFAIVSEENVVILPSRPIRNVKVFWKERIAASVNHSAPVFIGAGEFNSALGVPVFEIALGSQLALQSALAARLDVTAQKMDVRNNNFPTTIASSSTQEMPVFIGTKVGVNENPCETLTNEGVSLWHGIGSFNVVQVTGARLLPSACCDSARRPVQVNNN